VRSESTDVGLIGKLRASSIAAAAGAPGGAFPHRSIACLRHAGTLLITILERAGMPKLPGHSRRG
jgi:hypothetical protein